MLGRACSWIMKRIMIFCFCFDKLYDTFVWDCCDDLTVEMQTPLLLLFFLTLVGDRERGCFRWADNYRRWWWNLLIKIGAYFLFVFTLYFLLLLVRKILRCCCLYLYVDNNESRVCSCLNLFLYFGTFF